MEHRGPLAIFVETTGWQVTDLSDIVSIFPDFSPLLFTMKRLRLLHQQNFVARPGYLRQSLHGKLGTGYLGQVSACMLCWEQVRGNLRCHWGLPYWVARYRGGALQQPHPRNSRPGGPYIPFKYLPHWNQPTIPYSDVLMESSWSGNKQKVSSWVWCVDGRFKFQETWQNLGTLKFNSKHKVLSPYQSFSSRKHERNAPLT